METTTNTDTSRRTAANRQNAQMSTGPRTVEGKAVSARNATRHGLLGRATLLPDEAPEVFSAFAENLLAHLAPVGALEALLADRVVDTAWRLGRMARIESGLLVLHTGGFHAAADHGEEDLSERWAAVFRFDETAHGLMTLSRYEAALERSHYRAFHELQRLQAVRAWAVVAAPLAVDATVEQGGSDQTGRQNGFVSQNVFSDGRRRQITDEQTAAARRGMPLEMVRTMGTRKA